MMHIRRAGRAGRAGRVGRQGGFSLLELLISVTIGVFLLAGIAGVLAVTRQNFNAQAGMGQLQDDQRIAVNMLVSVVEHAGYYHDVQKETAVTSFPLAAPFVDEGHSVVGSSGSGGSSPGADSISVRYMQSPGGTASSDFLQDCNGISNTGNTAVLSVNTFTLDSQNQLTCAVGGNAAKPLAGGVSSFTVLYGVDRDKDRSVDFYLPAQAMPPSYWGLVGSVRVDLVFIHPLDRDKPITVKRVINLMGRA